MRKLVSPALIFCSLVMAHAAQAAPVVLSCPQSIDVSESGKPPAGWEFAATAQPRGFQSLTLFSGHPREMASLAPDSQRRKGQVLSSSWKIADSEKHWLACGYTQTTAQLVQRLPAGLKNCSATHQGPDRDLRADPKLSCE